MPLAKNAITVLEKRYLRKDDQGLVTETPDELFRRVARSLAEMDAHYGADEVTVSQTEEKFYKLLTDLDFLPNSPTLANAGTRTGQLSACFVLPVPDDLSSIFETVKHAALIHQTGGGTGFAFSRLRPRNDMVASTKGVSSGPVSFMDVFNAATESIKQGGMRRGANMGILRVDHPDILEFIRHKEDLSKLTNFNISVAITDAFMDALQKGTDYDLINPRDGEVWGQLDAATVWNDLTKRAWNTGEPGLVFMDRMNRYCPVPWMGGYESTNPCVTGDTRIVTSRGLVTVKELYDSGEPLTIASDLRGAKYSVQGNPSFDLGHGVIMRSAAPIFKTSDSEKIYKITTDKGYSIKATAYHKFITPQGRVELKDLQIGDTLFVQSGEGGFGSQGSRALGLVLGWLAGDGHFTGDRAVLSFYGEDKAEVAQTILDAANEIVPLRAYRGAHGEIAARRDEQILQLCEVEERNRCEIKSTRLKDLMDTYGVTSETKHHVPEVVWQGNREIVVAYLQALFTADGTVNASDRKRSISVRLAQSNIEFLREIQILLSNMGIVTSVLLRRKAGNKLMPDGKGGRKEYAYQNQYELILQGSNADRFAHEIGFLMPEKQSKLTEFIIGRTRHPYAQKFEAKIKSIEYVGEEAVYDTTEPVTHTITVNAIVTGQCGEQPLLPYESCNLGSINLENFVIEGPKGPDIDYDRLREAIHISTHMLDNVIDANNYPIEEIRDVTHATRKIGLGVMGFARMLFKLGVAYGTEESFEVSERVMSFLDYESKIASIELAKSRGSFSARDGHEEESNQFFARMLKERHLQPGRHPDADYAGLIPLIEQWGIRNSTTTTVAPTGTLSIIADTSGGIEPTFALVFKRLQADTEMYDTDKVFLEIAEKRGFYSQELMAAIDKNHGSLKGLEDWSLPADIYHVYRTAHDIRPEEHVLIQAAFQKYNDSATSKTINFSEISTVEDVDTAYRLAWETGCKGITVYRNNSRSFQPLNVSQAEAPPEPIVESVPQQSTTALFLAASNPSGFVPRVRPRPEDLYGFTRCSVTGEGKLYTTINYDEFGIREVVTNIGRSGGTLFSLSEAIGRLISLAFQYNLPVDEIAHKLIGIRGANSYGFGQNQVLSIPDAIGKVLKEAPRQLSAVLASQPNQPAGSRSITYQPAMSVSLNGLTERNGHSAVEIFGETPECPDCGGTLEYGEGCATCRSCGFSRCG